MKFKQSILLGGLAWFAALTLACAAVATPTPIPTAPPTPLPAPSATPVPTDPPTATPPPVTASTGLGPATDLEEVALDFLTDLTEDLGPRASASEEELAAARFLESELSALGYDTELQPFTLQELSGRLTINSSGTGPDQISEALPLAGAASGEAQGSLVSVGLGRLSDLPPEGLEGKIALVERGQFTFGQKVRQAQEAGASAVVIYNNRPGNFRGDLSGASAIPAVSISQSAGMDLKSLMAAGQLEARVVIAAEETPSRNVVAEKPGRSDQVIVLGAHYDTVPDVDGAHDNASGTAVLLTLAQELADRSYPFTLRFIAFGSEELGLHGSRFYVNSLSDEERNRIEVMINFDSVGSGSGLRILGDRELTEIILQEGLEQGIDVARRQGLGGGSDHMSFSRVGIPVVMFFSDDFSRLHTPQDVLEFINPRLLADASQLALKFLESLAPPTGTTI
ncbi:MAG: DUF4910 domain-containing protein [Dehalococcoidia bacterium]